MNNMQIRAFASKMTLLLPDTTKRRLVLPAIMGMAMGNFLPVKQGKELSPMTVFNDNHLANVSRAVSYLNEEMMVNVPATIEAARAMYLIRERILNGKPATYTVNPEFDIISIALGLSTVLPVETYKAIMETGLSASTLYGLANLLIEDLKKTNAIQL